MVVGSATLALAHHRAVLVNDTRVSEDPVQKCECRARGQAYTTGEQICLNGRIATCAMDQNVTTWKSSTKLCPEASLSLR
jgi:hypothetical protein